MTGVTDLSSTRAVRTCGSSMVKSSWRSGTEKGAQEEVPFGVVVCCASVRV